MTVALRTHGTPARIVDLLETWSPEWFTTDRVVAHLGADREAVRRALGRLRDQGLVVSRMVETTEYQTRSGRGGAWRGWDEHEFPKALTIAEWRAA